MNRLLLIGRLVLLLIVAIGSAIGLFLFLRLEFKDFEWGNGFWECFVSLFSAIILLINHISILIGLIVGVSWYGVIITIRKLFDIKEKQYHETYTGVDEYDRYEDHTWDNYE
jgi:uncharacterized protein YneF (UPF0154 family)